MSKELKIHEETMTSSEISEMTGKQHTDIRKDIARMISEVGDEAEGFSSAFPEERLERQASGQMAKLWYLDEAWSMLLVSGYEVKYRAVFIRFWKDYSEPQDISEMDMIATTAAELEREVADRIPEYETPGISKNDKRYGSCCLRFFEGRPSGSRGTSD